MFPGGKREPDDPLCRRTKLTHESRHPIGVVSARTGLPQDLIRAWERRYQAITPDRGPTGRRLYSDVDIEKLRLLRRAVTAGRRISDVASLPVAALRDLVAQDRNETAVVPDRGRRGGDSKSPAQELLEEALEAIESLDRRRLERALRGASVELTGPAMRRHLIGPLLETIGQRWHDGSLRIVHEHLASVVIRAYLNDNRNGHERTHMPRIVLATPAGQYHEIGALMAMAAAEESGWDACYLGPNLPAEEIAAAARQLGARAVALSIVYRGDDTHLLDELERARRLIDPSVPIFIGGRAVDSVRAPLNQAGLLCPADLAEFRDDLHAVLA